MLEATVVAANRHNAGCGWVGDSRGVGLVGFFVRGAVGWEREATISIQPAECPLGYVLGLSLRRIVRIRTQIGQLLVGFGVTALGRTRRG